MKVRLLLATPFRTREGLCSLQAGRVLLDALDERHIEVELHQPWLPVELDGFDAVLCWTYRHTWHNFLFYCKELEERCTELGLPVLNSAYRFNYRHSRDLAAWRSAGLPCARHQRFRRLADITLPYPLVIRRDGLHQGLGMQRVESLEEATIAANRFAEKAPGKPLDLVIEFLDTRWPDGFYRKRRCYVVGDRVIPAHALRSESWVVNFGSVAGTAASFREHRTFLDEGEPRVDVLRQALEVLDADWAAVDYSPTPEGGLVLWEANRNPRMWGDAGYPEGRPRSSERAYGLAIADLALSRIENTLGEASTAS